MQTDIVICGVGGQGVITAGKLISTASMISGKKVVMSEIHGLAQRGGSVSVDIRIGDNLGPVIPEGTADIIIAMEPMEAARNMRRASPDCVFLVNTQKMPPVSLGMDGKEYPEIESILERLRKEFMLISLDAHSIAVKTGEPRTVSSVMVGAASAVESLELELADILEAMRKIFPEKVLEPNITAFNEGREISMKRLKETSIH